MTPVATATKFDTKSATTQLGLACERTGVFGIKLWNDVGQILQWPILVAMATKFETKWAIIRLV